MLRPVHTKDDIYKDNDKDIVLKIVLNIKVYTTSITIKAQKREMILLESLSEQFVPADERYKHWESILLWAREFKVADE